MWKIIITLVVGMVLMGTGQTSAATPARPATVSGTLDKPENTEKIAAVVGHSGVLFIRSEARWDEFCKLLPDLTPDTPMPKIDFTKQNVVLVYDTNCRSKDTFQPSGPDYPNMGPPPESAQTDFLLSWDNSPEDQKEFRYAKFIAAIIPAIPTVRVFVLSKPLNAKPTQPCAIDFDANLGEKGGGDIVDGLQATIQPKAATVKPGEDILCDFKLHFAEKGHWHPKRFSDELKSRFVWDDTGSEGYRNYAFFVTTPDGKTTLLRPKEKQWLRTPIPHPVEITAENAYHLSGQGDAANGKSLKELGLDTSPPGRYTITGLYEETTGTDDKKPMWGGSIISNTITVEVTAQPGTTQPSASKTGQFLGDQTQWPRCAISCLRGGMIVQLDGIRRGCRVFYLIPEILGTPLPIWI